MKKLDYVIPTLFGKQILTEQQARAYAQLKEPPVDCEVYDGEKIIDIGLLHDFFMKGGEKGLAEKIRKFFGWQTPTPS